MGTNREDAFSDEVVWSNPGFTHMYGPLHNNTILMYFADSPWCEPTSNNKVVMNQSLYNPNLTAVVATRESFEARLKSMSGLEYIVHEAPAETGPGQGTGVWVIRKQTRKKRGGNLEDELTVHQDYFVIDAKVYVAPSLADIMSFRLASVTQAISKLYQSANSIQKWDPARGHVFASPSTARATASDTPQDTPPSPEAAEGSGGDSSSRTGQQTTKTELDSRLAFEAFSIHTAYGNDCMDEIPITGRPGDFHFASTGRKDKLAVVPAVPAPAPAVRTAPLVAPLNTAAKAAETSAPRDSIRKTKSPKPGTTKAKDRRKSKGGTATGTPTPI